MTLISVVMLLLGLSIITAAGSFLLDNIRREDEPPPPSPTSGRPCRSARCPTCGGSLPVAPTEEP